MVNYSLYVALKYPPASIQYFYTNATSNISPQKKKSRRQRRRLSTAGALLIRNTSTRRQAATSSVFIVLRRGKQVERKLNVFTSDHRERLHPPSLCELWRDKQARLLWSLVKMSRLHFITPWQGRKPSVLSEELLLTQKREVKPSVFALRATPWQVRLRYFFAQNLGKKMGW